MTAPLRVLYVDYSVGFGGATKSISLLFPALEGVERYVLTAQGSAIIAESYPGAKVLRFRTFANYRGLGRAKRWARRTVRIPIMRNLAQKALAALDVAIALLHCARVIRIIRRYEIALIHLNNGFTPLEAVLAARFTKTPCIVHLRGFPDPKVPGRVATYRTVRRAITVSNAVGTSLAAAPIPPDRIVTIYDPVDTDAFAAAAGARERTRAAWGIAPDDVAVGIFGRVVDWKGQREFVRSMLIALERAPQLKGVIVGDESDGARAYYDEVKTRIQQSPFAQRFVLTGYQPNVAELYHAMDIVVHASIQPEPFGMVVPEAMAAGKPVIAADAGGPREVVTDGVDGVLVPPGDVEGFARAIVALAGDGERRRAMGERGRRTVAARFRIPAIATQLMDVYRELR